MLITDEHVRGFYDWFMSEPTIDKIVQSTKRVDYIMYNNNTDGQYGNSTELELCIWVDETSHQYESDVNISKKLISISVASPFKQYEFEPKDFLDLTEEEFFQYSVIHDAPCISPESLVLLANLTKLLQEPT